MELEELERRKQLARRVGVYDREHSYERVQRLERNLILLQILRIQLVGYIHQRAFLRLTLLRVEANSLEHLKFEHELLL